MTKNRACPRTFFGAAFAEVAGVGGVGGAEGVHAVAPAAVLGAADAVGAHPVVGAAAEVELGGGLREGRVSF